MSVQSLNENRSQYLSEYLQKTLGVSQILNQNSEQSLSIEPNVDLGFFIEEYQTYTHVEKDLLNKMIQAMKLSENQYQILDLSEKNNSQVNFKMKIEFRNQPTSDFQTYSPRNLIVNPENKKNTWEFLKKIMSQVSL